MKKFLLAGILICALCLNAAIAKELTLSVRAGGEINSDRSFNTLSSAVNVDLLFEKLPFEVLNRFLNYGKFSLKPYIGFTFLPTTYLLNSTADNKMNYNLFGGMYFGIDTEYQLSQSNKLYLAVEEGNYGYSVKIGSKHDKVAAGIKLSNFFNYYFGMGLFGNYKFDYNKSF